MGFTNLDIFIKAPFIIVWCLFRRMCTCAPFYQGFLMSWLSLNFCTFSGLFKPACSDSFTRSILTSFRSKLSVRTAKILNHLELLDSRNTNSAASVRLIACLLMNGFWMLPFVTFGPLFFSSASTRGSLLSLIFCLWCSVLYGLTGRWSFSNCQGHVLRSRRPFSFRVQDVFPLAQVGSMLGLEEVLWWVPWFTIFWFSFSLGFFIWAIFNFISFWVLI
jgi:hypothetical protein